MRRRLALLVTATMALVLVAFLVPLAVLVRAVAADRAVSGATAEAQSLSLFVATAAPELLRPSVEQLGAAARHPLTVFLSDGTALGAAAARTPAVELAARGRSVTVAVPGGREILIAVQGLPGGTAVVRTFVPDRELNRGVPRAWLILAGLGLVLLVAGVAVADRLARSLVRPIDELAAVSDRLAAGDLAARAQPTGPEELRAVAAALNGLAGRIRELIWQERESLADLSHRLRTPLTALRLEAEALTGPGRVPALVAALERAVSEIIEDARRRGSGPGRSDAAEVVAERTEFWSVLAEDQGRAMTVELAPGPLPVRVDSADLAAAVDALLGNIFAHTPDGVAFAVRLAARPGDRVELIVDDAGSGLPGLGVPGLGVPGAADPLRRGASGGGSTGLGLDIVRQTARLAGGAVTLATGPLGGARVIVEFGPPSGEPLNPARDLPIGPA